MPDDSEPPARRILGQRRAKRRESAASSPPGDDGRLQRGAGFMVAPDAFTEVTGKRQFIGAALVLAQYLDRQARRRLSFAIELGQPFFARCHFQFRFRQLRRAIVRQSQSSSRRD